MEAGVSIVAMSPQMLPRAQVLASRLALELVPRSADAAGLVLEVHPDNLALRDCTRPGTRALVIEPHARRAPAYGRDLISRALGRGCRTVIDATAGFGTDAFDFVRRGKQVLAIERVGVIAEMLMEAARRSCEQHGRDDLTVISADAREQIAKQARADVIFLDPMFPGRDRHSARPRKAQQLLRALAGDDLDAEELARIARDKALKRVVIKRPRTAPPLAGKPDHCFRGRSVRYDIYFSHTR